MELTAEYVLGLLSKTQKALASLEVLDDKGQQIVDMATRYLEDAIHFLENEELEMAMAAEEYSHGLLDGGVGAGALKITANPELFVF